jgi:hydrogenase maturation factor
MTKALESLIAERKPEFGVRNVDMELDANFIDSNVTVAVSTRINRASHAMLLDLVENFADATKGGIMRELLEASIHDAFRAFHDIKDEATFKKKATEAVMKLYASEVK